MFTGIIESVGQISSLKNINGDFELIIKYDNSSLNDIALGDSISINGICLTVTKYNKNSLRFDLSNETISRISKMIVGNKVNLERSLKINSRISGHFVFGHVDGVAKLINIEKKGSSEIWTIKTPKKLMKYISEKGSISLNGISLTINGVTNDSFKINLIPHTIKNTCFKYTKIKDEINIEIDMLARYVETIINKRK